ncbi:tyrosine-protein phosphatase [Erysipelothrix sp. HDW6A]|uniref:tyrosine-protein phosphatase n=1 Tax=Erysipelothrix sp. HDW6A TaxID=2714928 RepID=UPI00140B4D2A|nr:tyrosine-protein phosphatase [Erysipelothrix sp. HDW6A]QIK58172.1 tyrosine-protein phosphatase [Erysipelothrix sp. HDW6A]
MFSVLNEIKLTGIRNFRGLGGISTKDGYVVKNNLIFRSQALTNLSEEDINLLEQVGIKSVVDFRSLEEVEAAPDDIIKGAVYYNITPNAMVAKEAAKDSNDKVNNNILKEIPDEMKHFLDNPDQLLIGEMKRFVSGDDAIMVYKKFIHMFKDKSNLPIIFHCRGGKDRAGFAAMLILLALGVSKEAIIEEYLLTEQLNKENNILKMARYEEKYKDKKILELRKSLMSAKESYILAAFEEIEQKYQSIENYLEKVLDLTSDNLNQIRENCLIDYRKEV